MDDDESPDVETNYMDDLRDERDEAVSRLKRATDLLREWRDKYGAKEYIGFYDMYQGGPVKKPTSASPTDLIRDTTRFLEGK